MSSTFQFRPDSMRALPLEAFAMARRIDAYDLSQVTGKLVHDGRLSSDQAERAATEFKRFVFLAGLGVKPLAMIGPLVDEVWHQFILFTKDYKDFCNSTVGWFVGHQPDTAARPIPITAGQNFLTSYKSLFGSLPDIWWEGMDTPTRRYYELEPLEGRPPSPWSGWTGEY